MSREAMTKAIEALKKCHYYMIDAGLPNQSMLHEAFAAYSGLEAALAEQPKFTKHAVEQTSDWSEWVCPDPKGYLMKCCDCGLVHEMQFGVAKYKPNSTEDCDMVDDPNLQAVFRMRRSEQWSPEDTAHRAGGLTMEQPAPVQRKATTYAERFAHAVAVLCGAQPPADMVAEWIANTEVNGEHRLQGWVLTQAATPFWAQGIVVLDAAHVLANDPEEGEGHDAAPQPAQQQEEMPDDWFKDMPEEYRREAWRIKEQPAQRKPLTEPKTKDVVIDNMGKPFVVKAYVDPQPPAQQERWVVFCGLCFKEWSVPYQHPGKSVCENCEAAHGITGKLS